MTSSYRFALLSGRREFAGLRFAFGNTFSYGELSLIFRVSISGCTPPRCQQEFGDFTWTRLAASAKVFVIHQEQDMAYVVAIVSPGEMGSAVAARLSERGVRVVTSLAGRSPAS